MAWDYEKLMAQLQDSMTVVAAVQERPARAIKDNAEWVQSLQDQQERHRQLLLEHQARFAAHERALDRLMTRHEELATRHEELVAQRQESEARHEQFLAEHERRLAEFDIRDAEMQAKLNALIDIVDGNIRGKN